MSKPDWGHGPNPPVPTYTEAEISKVLDNHYPTPDTQYGDYPLCSCASKVWPDGYTDWTERHFLDKLKEARNGS